jgi:hypothetical protein
VMALYSFATAELNWPLENNNGVFTISRCPPGVEMAGG